MKLTGKVNRVKKGSSMSETEKSELINFIAQYNGENDFLLSLRKWHHDGKTLTPKQLFVASLEYKRRKRIAEKAAAATQEMNQPKKESEEMQNVTFETLSPVVPQQVPQSETPNLDNTEKMLGKIAGEVVADCMAKAEAKLGAIIAKAEAAAGMQKVMHVRVNGGEVRKIESEAHELLADCIGLAKLGETPLLVGPKGCGKSTLAEQVSQALGLRFGHLCFSSGASETWLFGRQLPQGIVEAQFSDFYKNGGVFLLDEFDAADANLLMALNSCLAGNKFFNPITQETILRHQDFICIAAANTNGLGSNAQYTGRNRLDAATLDRFVALEIDYNEKLEKQLVADKKLLKTFHKARKELAKRNSSESISTRWLVRAEKLLRAGWDWKKVIGSMTLAWPEGLAKEVGLLDGIEEKNDGEAVPF